MSEPLRDPAPGEVTLLLRRVRAGEADALERLVPAVYDELRRIAAGQLRREGNAGTLQATALVHEAYVKLATGSDIDAEDRGHFLAIVARAMRQVLVDHARRRRASKRGGEWARTTLSDGVADLQLDPDDLLALDRGLEQLEARQRQVVELRFFAGLEEREVADALGVSYRTVRRDWATARARLYRTLYLDGGSRDTAGPAEEPGAEP